MRNRLHSTGLITRRPQMRCRLPEVIDKPGWHGQGSIVDGLTNNGQLYFLQTSHGFCWIFWTEDVAFGVAEQRGTRTAPLLNMIGMMEEVKWHGRHMRSLPYRAGCA